MAEAADIRIFRFFSARTVGVLEFALLVSRTAMAVCGRADFGGNIGRSEV